MSSGMGRAAKAREERVQAWADALGFHVVHCRHCGRATIAARPSRHRYVCSSCKQLLENASGDEREALKRQLANGGAPA